jgi:pyridoxamine 5'-phosphate oxidase
MLALDSGSDQDSGQTIKVGEAGNMTSEPEQASDAIPVGDPFALFGVWFDAACLTEPNDANAMALATATPSGIPSLRMVLLKGHGPQGFTFYTNVNSRKGSEIAANPVAAMLFHWKSLRRQIRIEGPLAEVDAAIADRYFDSRSRESQLGAIASDQSAPLASRGDLLARHAEAERRFAGGAVDRPGHWTGFQLRPTAIEFWLDRPHRLHERRRFEKTEGGWNSALLYP